MVIRSSSSHRHVVRLADCCVARGVIGLDAVVMLVCSCYAEWLMLVRGESTRGRMSKYGVRHVTVRVYVVMLAWFEFGKRDSLESLRWISLRWISSRLGTDLNYSTRHPHVTVGSVAAISLSLSSTVLLGFWLVGVGPTSRFE